jgi:hypothetical protein
MNYYKLNAVINDENIRVNKMFRTRDDAINYMFYLLKKEYIYNVSVEDEFELNGNKHNIQYVLRDNVRFNVSRETI